MLCADETPMVRRAAAHKMRDFVSVCAKQAGSCGDACVSALHPHSPQGRTFCFFALAGQDLLTDLIGVYKQLSQEDTQDPCNCARNRGGIPGTCAATTW